MSEPKRVPLIIIVLIALAAVLLVMDVAYGDDDDRGHGHGHDDGDSSAVDASSIVTGDSSWGIGAGGPGDVEINNCWGSTQWGGLTIFRQKLVTLETCLGFRFLALKKYELAAMHFCNDKPTLKEFANEAECEAEHDFTPPDPLDSPNLGGLYDQATQFNEHYDLAQQQQEEIEYLKEENASFVGRLDQLTAYIEQEPARAPTSVQKQEPQYSEAQFNAVWLALGIEDEDDE